ncbi:hypothetical protein AGMMS50276_29380 [Synergistales bacterium]|nr:hypothetical protein AGMMS50276_29380 [Synergistales bacterium]
MYIEKITKTTEATSNPSIASPAKITPIICVKTKAKSAYKAPLIPPPKNDIKI